MGKIHRWGMIIAVLIIIGSVYVGVKSIFIEQKSSTVPSLVGMQLVDAVDALQKVGLLAKVDKVDSPMRADTVVSQSLPAGEKTGSGKVVILKVSKGGAMMPIPDVRGLNFEEAVRKLGEAGFKVNKVIRVTDKLKPIGAVIAQNPAAPQQVSAASMISLLVSTGTTSAGDNFVIVPDIRGQALDLAKDILVQSELSLGRVSEVPSISMPAGSIVSTRPGSGAKMPRGSQISVSVARLPKDGELTQDAPSVPGTERTEPVRTVVITDPVKKDDPAPEPPKPSPDPAKPEPAKPELPKPEPAKPQATAGNKIAKIRYQVPPLSKPLSLKIEMTDAAGRKVLRDATAQSGEYISMNVPYDKEATITIFLGGDFVWQDRFN